MPNVTPDNPPSASNTVSRVIDTEPLQATLDPSTASTTPRPHSSPTIAPVPRPAANIAQAVAPDGDDGDKFSYHDLTANKLTNVLRWLDIPDEAEFEQWLSQQFVIEAYDEFAGVALDPERIDSEATIAQGRRPGYNESVSSLNTKVQKAVDALNKTNSKYLEQHPNKTAWMKDDHATRFIVRIVSGARAPGKCWSGFQEQDHTTDLCRKALGFMRWLQSIHRPTSGKSSDTMRKEKKKLAWYEHLQSLRPRHSAAATIQTPAPPTEAVPVVREASTLLRNASEPLPLPTSQFGLDGISEAGSLPGTDPPSPPLLSPTATNNFSGFAEPVRTPSTVHYPDLPMLNEAFELASGTSVSTPSSSPDAPTTASRHPRPITPTNANASSVTETATGIAATSLLATDLTSGNNQRPKRRLNPSDRSDKRQRRARGATGDLVPARSEQIALPSYPVTQSNRLNQLKGVTFLTEVGYNAWTNQLYHRLMQWGVTIKHTESCVLVPQSWKNRSPSDMLPEFRSITLDSEAEDESRLVRSSNSKPLQTS